MLSLTDLRSPEQVEADEEIDGSARDEPDDLIRKLQDAMAPAMTFYDAWMARNNLPAPPCPGCLVREFAGRDLVAEEAHRVISRQVIVARRQRKVEMQVLTTETQLSLL